MIRKNNAGKRQAKVVELTKELEECIGDGGLQSNLDKEDIGEFYKLFKLNVIFITSILDFKI